MEAYALATDPSSVSSMRMSWDLLDRKTKAEEELGMMGKEDMTKASEQILERAKKEIAELAKSNSSQDSPISNLDSSQESSKT